MKKLLLSLGVLSVGCTPEDVEEQPLWKVENNQVAYSDCVDDICTSIYITDSCALWITLLSPEGSLLS